MPLRSLDGVWRHFSFASTSRLCWRQGCVLSRDPPISSCKGGRQVKRKRRDSRQPRAVAPVCRCKTRAGVGAERRPKRRKVSGPSRKVCPPAAPVALDPPFFFVIFSPFVVESCLEFNPEKSENCAETRQRWQKQPSFCFKSSGTDQPPSPVRHLSHLVITKPVYWENIEGDILIRCLR